MGIHITRRYSASCEYTRRRGSSHAATARPARNIAVGTANCAMAIIPSPTKTSAAGIGTRESSSRTKTETETPSVPATSRAGGRE